jgi:cytochrome c553
MTLRPWRWLLGLLIAALALGAFAWFVLLRPVPQRLANDPAVQFNHGSIGNEAAQGVPYWIWRVLPKIFADKLPGDGGGYAAFGMFWEPGAPLPVGFSEMRLGAIGRVTPNCAFCHQGSYRLSPQDPPRLVSAGPGTRVDPQAYIRFLAATGQDPRFTADRILEEIGWIYDMPLWERMTYRFLLVPATRKALRTQASRFAWTETRPDWGPGRIDPFNPVKFQNLGLPDDGTIGNSDMMPLWTMAATDATPLSRKALHWDGLLTDLHETVVAGAIGDGMDHKSWPRTQASLAAMEDFIRHQAPPPSPFSADLPEGDPYRVDAQAVARGQAIYVGTCAECHAATGLRNRSVIPVAELGTDRHRIDMWTEAARDRYMAYSPDYDWGFRYFQKAEGYVALPHDGLWLRGPYLHNGSVPNLRAMLTRPEDRPAVFWRGSDLVDPVDGGFVSAETGDTMRRPWRYDTTLPGNSNAGHRWGTDLPPEDKDALLAYLKTL